MSKLTDILIQVGAPILKSTIEQQIGGIGGKLAGSVIDGLASQLSVPPTEEAIVERFEREPAQTTQIIHQVEADMARIVEAQSRAMMGYQSILMEDIKSEGILSRLWRPLFAIVFTVTFGMVGVTFCWLMWTRQLSTITQLSEVASFLTFYFIAGCAVLGVQVFQAAKTDRSSA